MSGFFDTSIYSNQRGFDLLQNNLKKINIELPENVMDILKRIVGIQTQSLNLDWFDNLHQDFYRIFRENRTVIGHGTVLQALNISNGIISRYDLREIDFNDKNWFNDFAFNLFKMNEPQILKKKNIQPKHISEEELQQYIVEDDGNDAEAETKEEKAERLSKFAEECDLIEDMNVEDLSEDGLKTRRLLDSNHNILSVEDLLIVNSEPPVVEVNMNAEGDIIITCPYSGSTDVYKIDSKTYAAFGVDKPFKVQFY